MSIQSQPIGIIGGGIGALSAAIRLAAAKKRVILFKKNATVGGKMGEVRDAGYRRPHDPLFL
ncbi:MAG: FAD/NAD(P)-binding protein [Litorilinea sp.]